MIRHTVSIWIILIVLLCGCKSAAVFPTANVEPTGVLTPFQTVTPTSSEPTPTLIVTIPVTPVPSPTPFLHTLTDNDTMLGIAYQYGISLEDLQAANPGVDPHFLSVGKQLVIPINGELAETLPVLTPEPVDWGQPTCYRSGEGGLTCIMTVSNDLEYGVENLATWMGLYSPTGEILTSQTVYAPLNLLPPGSTIPLMAYFEPPMPDVIVARGELSSGIKVAEDDSRYLPAQADAVQVEISLDGKQAKVSGAINIPNDNAVPSQLWVLAIAYDIDQKIIGVRRWESSGELEFSITVYSLEGTIDHVEILPEARQ